jgi:hypothetical protein
MSSPRRRHHALGNTPSRADPYAPLTSQDFWIRRHLRCLIWRQWKRPETRFNHLRKRGCPKDRALLAYKRRGPWWCSGTPALTQTLNPTYFKQLGLFNLLDAYGAT